MVAGGVGEVGVGVEVSARPAQSAGGGAFAYFDVAFWATALTFQNRR